MSIQLHLSELTNQYAFHFDLMLKSIIFTAVSHDFSSKTKGRVAKTFSENQKGLSFFMTFMTYMKVCCALACVLLFASKYTEFEPVHVFIAAVPVVIIIIATTVDNPKNVVIDFAETYGIAYFWHWIMQQRYLLGSEQNSAICFLNTLLLFLFSWPLVDGSITVKGVCYRIILFLLYPFAYSNSETSEIYQESSMKPHVDWWMYTLQMAIMFLAISGLKGRVSVILNQQWAFFRNLNYWGIFGLLLFPILATQDFPMTLKEVPTDWHGVPTWFSTPSEPKLTPFLFSFLHNYKWV